MAELWPRLLFNRGEARWTKAHQWALQPEHAHLRRTRVFRGKPDNADEPLYGFVWLASVHSCEPCPTQSAAIVTVRMPPQPCVGLQCFTAILSLQTPTLSPYTFIFLCANPVILSQHYTCNSILALLHFLIFYSSSSLPKCYALLLCVLFLCKFLCHFLTPTCSSFSNGHHCVCSLVYLFFVPNHFALLMFQRAGTLTGDMEVHLPRQEQPGGTSTDHQLHAPVSRVGFKTTAKMDYHFL